MFDELALEGPTPEEIDRTRRRMAWDARCLADSAEDMSAFFASGLLFDRFSTPEEHVARLANVDANDVREVAGLIARPEKLSVVAVGLLDDGEDERLEEAVRGWSGPAR
jgi:predicted Zn-dependent peptidase